MDLIKLSANLINEIQGMRRDYRSGKISLETFTTELNGICQIEKLANVMIKTRITEERFRKPIDAGQRLIALEDPENELIECPGCSREIERSLCLDYSGEDPPKFEECKVCEHYVQTRNLLLEEKKVAKGG